MALFLTQPESEKVIFCVMCDVKHLGQQSLHKSCSRNGPILSKTNMNARRKPACEWPLRLCMKVCLHIPSKSLFLYHLKMGSMQSYGLFTLSVYGTPGLGPEKMGCVILYRTFHITQGPGHHCFLLYWSLFWSRFLSRSKPVCLNH